MAQEFTIKSEQIESKINQLLPSQGGYQAGIDFSASTMVVPIIDLTETAEGSALRADLQSSLSFNNSDFDVKNATSTLINTTGYFRNIGTMSCVTGSGSLVAKFIINDGVTDKVVWQYDVIANTGQQLSSLNYDFLILLKAGHSFKATTNNSSIRLQGSTRQIADLSGNLTNP